MIVMKNKINKTVILQKNTCVYVELDLKKKETKTSLYIARVNMCVFAKFKRKILYFKSSGTIYYCTHDDNDKPDHFKDFCKKMLPDYSAKSLSSGIWKEPIVLVLSVPTKTRLNPYRYFSERVKTTIQNPKFGLNEKGMKQKTDILSFYLSIINCIFSVFITHKNNKRLFTLISIEDMIFGVFFIEQP